MGYQQRDGIDDNGPGAVRGVTTPPGGAERLRFFQQKGFVVVKGVLDREEVRDWRSRAASAIEQEFSQAETHPYHSVIFSIHQLAARYPVFEALVRSAALGDIASNLMSGEARILLDQLICKPPKGRATIPHQDAPFLPLGDQPTVNCWIALDDVKEANGALIYFAGSHRLPRMPLVHLDREPSQLDPRIFGMIGSTTEMFAGDCVFHHGRTVHAANPNSQETHRLAISIQYMLDGALACEPLHPFMRQAGIRPGDALTSDCFPRPWSLS